ncbi:hypothetical protein [Micromonospora sp. ATCC 39149]|uniref:Uncharacterized protein n=1 Tax=Micromonospora carbonacea TaxID=47853 RepID=A0A7D6CGG5_9ACTN|nr:hypothetical protein [Micromonospora sp. ATCC 39149]QLK00959.1 hypothetical protein HZU44_13780 [Micromonospora carbonacea]
MAWIAPTDPAGPGTGAAPLRAVPVPHRPVAAGRPTAPPPTLDGWVDENALRTTGKDRR